MGFIFVCAFLSFALEVLVDAECNQHSGPIGSSRGGSECVKFSDYNKYQWATCFRHSYINTFSKGSHECANKNATYCWYQCMLESHESEEGSVYDDCACEPDAVSTTSRTTRGPDPVMASSLPDDAATTSRPTHGPDPTTTDSLPGWCYSPDGTNCDWYTECLEKRHPCASDKYGYAVQFALKFCNLYSKNQHDFSSQGQRWIDAVRKCLQVKLVPIIRPYVQTNCEEIQQKAFATHAPCYLAPYPGEPSICNLDPTDWVKVFWTMKGAFLNAAVPSLKGMYDVIRGCANFILENIHGMRLTMLTFKNVGGRSVKMSISDDPNETADSVAKQLAEQLQWKQNGVQWFSYINDSEQADDISVGILLGPRSMYDINAVNAFGVPEADINKTVDDFAEAIGNEELHLNVRKDLNLIHFSACVDFGCRETYHDVTTSSTVDVKVHGAIFAISSSILTNQLVKHFLP